MLLQGFSQNFGFLVLSIVIDYLSLFTVALAFQATTMHIKIWAELATFSLGEKYLINSITI